MCVVCVLAAVIAFITPHDLTIQIKGKPRCFIDLQKGFFLGRTIGTSDVECKANNFYNNFNFFWNFPCFCQLVISGNAVLRLSDIVFMYFYTHKYCDKPVII